MHVAQYWRLKAQRYSLQGSKCVECGRVSFPPRSMCTGCFKETQETKEIHVGPSGARERR